MREQYSAGIVVFRQMDGEREYLLLHHGGGHWDFPKGKMEPGESKRETALRELKEEANITAEILDGFEQNLSYYFSAPDGERIHKTVYFFVGEAGSRAVVSISNEHQDFIWLSYADAIQKVTYKNAEQILMYADAFLEARNRYS
ncbi:NUDIX domain-containing protein [Candidatus Babeliales bacterium]|nr:NUDIX domain-containing protein [Candidatus Babeliales bacterium]